jgi:hypothetical protein
MATRVTWFQQWFGGEMVDRRAINNHALDIDLMGGDLDTLKMRVAEQDEVIKKLRTTVIALGHLVVSKGLISQDELQDEIQHVIAGPPASSSEHPYRIDTLETDPTAIGQRCARCGGMFPKEKTTITANGTLCDTCFNT